jgi:Anti-sigma factor NepR
MRAKTAELLIFATAAKGTHMLHKGKSVATVARETSVSSSTEPGLDRNIQARIGDNLRAMYDELLQQPVPDRFKDLLGQIDKRRDGREQGR